MSDRRALGLGRFLKTSSLDLLLEQKTCSFPASSGYVERVIVGGALLIACGLALAWPTLRVIRAPEERWIQGRTQWLLFIWARRGEAPPSASELRLWASIWLAVATILLGLGVALIASA